MSETQTERHTFEKLLGNVDKWATVDDIVALCDGEGFWSKDFLAQSEVQAKKSHVRRLIRQAKDASGWPVWASVETVNEEGKTVRVYKQETLFGVEDYRQAISYHAGISKHHAAMVAGYARRCKKRFNRTIQMTFDSAK